ncbi:MAG: Gldg family protein [Chloroflexota bacterium]
MKPDWRRFAPWGLYLTLVSVLVAFGLYIVQREITLPLQISLALAILGLAGFVFLDPKRVQQILTGRQVKYGSNALVLSLAFIGILIVLNFLVYHNTKRWDLTEDKEHTLAPESIDTLNALPQPVTALAFFTPNLPTDQARGLLEDFKYHAKDKFDYRFIDPEEDPVLARQAEIDRDGTIVLQMGDQQERVSYTTEQELTAALVRLISPEERVVYFLTGHGERDPDDYGDSSYSQVKDVLQRKNYSVQTLNLLATHTIPLDASVIVVAGPIVPVSIEEIALLNDVIENGGGLIVMEEPLPLTDFGTADDPMQEYLESSWGVTLGSDVILDMTSNQPLIAIAYQYSDHVVTNKVQGLITIFPTARSVQVTGSISAVSQEELIRTAPQSWAETDLKAFTTPEQLAEIAPDEGEDLIGPVPLAVVAENFDHQSKLVVIGDVDFASNGYFASYGNGDLIINAVDWAAGQEDLINLTPKEQTTRILIPPQKYYIGLIFLGVVFVLPGLTLLGGILTWIQRRRRG